MKKGLGLIAGAALLGLAGCGDSVIVEKCIEDGNSAKACRCADKIMRSELSSEEYRLAEKAAGGDNDAVQEAIREKGAGFALAFAGKMAGTAMKMSEKCEIE